MKRGPDLDIEALFTDLENDPLAISTNGGRSDGNVAEDDDAAGDYDDHVTDEDRSYDDEFSER